MFGDSCYNNIFGSYCYNNTFGDTCFKNTFGDRCIGNNFGYGFNCNNIGNYFSYNTAGIYCCDNNFYAGTSGTTKKDYIRFMVLEDYIAYNNFYFPPTTSSSAYLLNIRIRGINHSEPTPVQITLSETNTDYNWVVARDSSGIIKQYCPEDAYTQTEVDDIVENITKEIKIVMPVLEVFTKKEIRRINPDDPEDNDYYNHNLVPAPNDLSDELNYVDYHIYFSVIGDDTILNNLDKYYICLMRNNKNGSKRGWKIMDDSTSSFNIGNELFDLFSDYCVYPIKLSDCEIANFTTSGKGCIQFKYPYRTSYLLNRIFCIHDEELNRKTPLDLINIGTENQELYIYNPGAGVGRTAPHYHITPNRSTLSYPLKFVLTYGNNTPPNEFENPSGQRQAPKSNSVDAKIMINPISSQSVGHDGQQYPTVDGYTVIMTTKN